MSIFYYAIRSDVESDHHASGFVPPPAGAADILAQPPLPEKLPALEKNCWPATALRVLSRI